MEWRNEVIIEFLDLYEAEPAIWNPQNENHRDRNQVYDAWKRIQAKISIECSLKDLKRKKENLMSTFRKLSSKVKKSSTTGSGSDEVYKPEWFAYDKMASFLHNVYVARGTTATERPKNDDAADEGNTTIDIEDDTSATINDEGDSSTATGPNHIDSKVTEPKVGPPLLKKRKTNNALFEKRMDQAYNFLQKVATKPKNKKGEIELFCDLLCIKLEALDEHKRDIVMHEINMLMFNAKNTSVQPNGMPTQYFCPQPPNCIFVKDEG